MGSWARTIIRNPTRHLAVLIGCATAMAAVAADITFYEQDGMRGRSFTANGPIDSMGLDSSVSSARPIGGRISGNYPYSGNANWNAR